jgi:hypothetical protein
MDTHTLYRIVSVRNPERSKKEKQTNRFVFYFENEKDLIYKEKGHFYKIIKNKNATVSNQEALKIGVVSFVSFESEIELEKQNKLFFEIADWLTINRKTAKPTEILKKVKTVKILDLTLELLLWDNLFANVIKNENHYIKDGIIQMLVLQNLLKHIDTKKDDEVLKYIMGLANAKVVLPTYIFEDNEAKSNNSNQNKIALQENKFVSAEILEASEIANTNLNIKDYETAIVELKKLNNKYQKAKQQSLTTANEAYQKKIKPIIAKYQLEYNKLRREMCKIPRDENYDPNDFCNQPDIQYPELPEFVFEYPKVTDIKYLQENLTENSFFIVEVILNDNQEIETIDEIINFLENAIVENQNVILSKKQFANPVYTIGDVTIPFASRVASNLTFRVCPTGLPNRNIYKLTAVFNIPDQSLNISGILYKLHLADGTVAQNYGFTASKSGNIITLTDLFGAYGYTQVLNNLVVGFSAEIKLSNNQYYNILLDDFALNNSLLCSFGNLENQNSNDNPDDFIPKGFGFKQLGIADYKKVVSKVCCYDAGEVAHIENVMASEFRSKTTEKKRVEENTLTLENSSESEQISDTVSTQRFEMQNEIASMIQEQTQTGAFANVQGNYGTTSFDAGGNYASNISKEESNRQTITQAKEMTQRAMERIVTKQRSEKVTKITESFTETNTHIYDNRNSIYNISSVYRFVNAVYKNQVFNYGKRLMYEFMVPQPSRLHLLGLEASATNKSLMPIDPRTIGLIDFNAIERSTYMQWASKYNAKVNTCPEEYIIIGKAYSFVQKTRDSLFTITSAINLPDNYVSVEAKTYFSSFPQGPIGLPWTISLISIIGNKLSTSSNDLFFIIDKFSKEVPINIEILGFHSATVNVTIKCQLKPEALQKWKKETFEAIIEAYNRQLEDFNAQQESKFLDSNPLFYRQTEQLILRKNCISYLLDDTNANTNRQFGLPMYNNSPKPSFTTFKVNVDQKMDDYTSFAKFMEQAFEWNLMSYNFYPYYWGYKDDWKDLYQYESNDPTFRSFMQAGMARVVVTVKPGFEDAIMHFMAFGQIWQGGQMPVLGNPMYLSLVDEIKEQEYVVEETWETIMPTNLIALQKDGVAVDESGLPCDPSCKDPLVNNLIKNDKKLVVILPPKPV